MHARRILVIGCPGSGKSCFARVLGEITGLPVCHLDLLYWNPDRSCAENGLFLSRLRNALARESWIIDGNYASTLEERLRRCDAVFLLDISPEDCIAGILARMNRPRPDMPWVETEPDPDFMDFVRGFRQNVLPEMLEILARHPEKQLVRLNSRQEAQLYLDALEKA